MAQARFREGPSGFFINLEASQYLKTPFGTTVGTILWPSTRLWTYYSDDK